MKEDKEALSDCMHEAVSHVGGSNLVRYGDEETTLTSSYFRTPLLARRREVCLCTDLMALYVEHGSDMGCKVMDLSRTAYSWTNGMKCGNVVCL